MTLQRSLLTIACILCSVQAFAATKTIAAGDDLQAALTAAQPGDILELAAGATFTGNFVLPTKPDGPAITLRSNGTLPDRRVTLADRPLLASIVAPNADPALLCAKPSAHWRLDGLWVSSTSEFNETITLDGCHDLRFERSVVVGGEKGKKRGMRGNGTSITVTRSYFANIWAPGQDSQAFCAWDGAGPYTLTDNYFEGAGENVMFGGAASKTPVDIPADILVENNDFFKPIAWKDASHPASVKNLFELKAAKRAVIRNNRFENNWTKSQNGYAILVTTRNDDGNCNLHPDVPCDGQGGAPWTVVEDVLFENNTLKNVEKGFNILGIDSYAASGRTTRITIRGNTVQTQYNFIQMGGEIGELTVSSNTVDNGGLFGLLYHGEVWPAWESPSLKRASKYAVEKLTMEGNKGKRYDVGGVLGEAAGWEPTKAFTQPTTQHLAGHAPGAVWATNDLVLVEVPPEPPPPQPTDPCVTDPFRPTVTKWPVSQTKSASGTWNPNGKTVTSAQFLWNPQRFVATDSRGCTVTRNR